jgi:hypothetical protein
MSASFSFRPAARENVSLLLAFAGASGSGKTYTALTVAKGLAQGKPIAFVDTEARRGLHYADRFDFLHADMRPPFRPENFVEAIKAAEAAGAAVVILDSFSHEYDGEGGILDWAADLEANGTKAPGNWKAPKLAHKRLMNALLQVRAHLIFCLRADEKIEIVREGGRTQVRPLGWMPICEKRFMFEMTASFTLTPDRPGIPQFNLPHKCQEQHRGFFPEGQQIGASAGEGLAAWALGGAARPAAPAVRLVVVKPGKDAGEYVAPSVQHWTEACARAIAAQPDAPALGAWRMAMAPHFMAAEHADVGAVDHVQGVAQRRLDELADAAPA